jgi:hypothetical protein
MHMTIELKKWKYSSTTRRMISYHLPLIIRIEDIYAT